MFVQYRHRHLALLDRVDFGADLDGRDLSRPDDRRIDRSVRLEADRPAAAVLHRVSGGLAVRGAASDGLHRGVFPGHRAARRGLGAGIVPGRSHRGLRLQLPVLGVRLSRRRHAIDHCGPAADAPVLVRDLGQWERRKEACWSSRRWSSTARAFAAVQMEQNKRMATGARHRRSTQVVAAGRSGSAAEDERLPSESPCSASPTASLYGIKTVLPKTSETIELLERSLMKAAKLPAVRRGPRKTHDGGAAEIHRRPPRPFHRLGSRHVAGLRGRRPLLRRLIFCRRDY